MITRCIVIMLLLSAHWAITRAQPATEIYLFDVNMRGGDIKLRNGQNITNHEGYDNQPFFHPREPTIYFVSADSTGQADIFTFNYVTGEKRQFTRTPENEFSPTVTPDQRYVSCIIQRMNGDQDLAKIPIDGGDPIVVINNRMVGYHAWGDDDHVAVFTLPAPFQLYLVGFKNQPDTLVAVDIGRSLHRIPGQNAISFLQNQPDGWHIQKFDLRSRKVTTILLSPAGSVDMAWTQKGQIVISRGRKLYYCDPNKSTTIWKEIQIESGSPEGDVTRIAVSKDGKKMAIVVNEK